MAAAVMLVSPADSVAFLQVSGQWTDRFDYAYALMAKDDVPWWLCVSDAWSWHEEIRFTFAIM